MTFVAGMDWTTYKKPLREIRGVGLVAVSDFDVLDMTFQNVKKALGLSADHVFHAYDDAEEIQLGLLQAVLAADIIVLLGAIIYDTKDGIVESIRGMSEIDFTHDIGIRLLREFLPLHPLDKLVADKELEGSKKQTQFKKAVRSVCHAIPVRSPDIQFWSAKEKKPGSLLVQLADAFIYNFYRSRRGVIETPELRSLLRTVEGNPDYILRNLVDMEK